jgi:hypothetical protein
MAKEKGEKKDKKRKATAEVEEGAGVVEDVEMADETEAKVCRLPG